MDTRADSLTFAFEEASPRQASLMAIHALHTPKTAISRAGSASPVPGLAAIEAEAARQLARLLDNWRKKYPDVPVSQAVEYGHPGPALVGLSAPPTWWSLAGTPVGPACQVPVQSGTPS